MISVRARRVTLSSSVLALLPLVASAQTTWTGGSNTTWDNPGNWDAGVPDASTDAIIASTANQPSGFIVDPVCRDLTIQAGATLTLGSGFDLTVAGDLDLDGTLTVTSSSSDIVVTGDWMNDGTYSNGGGMVELAGTGAIGGTSTTAFQELAISSGSRTASADFSVAGDVAVSSGVALVLNGTSYVVGGNWTSSAAGISITGTGTIEFNGSGTLTTSSNGLPNVLITAGTRNVNTSTIDGDLQMTGGSLQILDDATLTVGGSADLSAGTLGFTSFFAGLEVLDVDGDLNLTATAGTTNADTVIRCGGNLTTSSAFLPAGGVLELNGGSSATISGTGLALQNVRVVNGSKTFLSGATLAGDLTVESNATLTTSGGALDVNGKVVLGDATASWDLGGFTHTVAGNWVSVGADATGSGAIQFDGPGGLTTGAGSIANVEIVAGTRSTLSSNVAGDLSMTGGALTILDNSELTVGGSASLTGGTLTFSDSTAGLETLDVEGDLVLTATSGGTTPNTLIDCGGSWTSSGAFTFSAGTARFDGGGADTLSGAGSNFANVTLVSGSLNVTAAIPVTGNLTVVSGALLDTDAALDVGGNVVLGDGTASWDLGPATHTVAGGYTSSGASATGAGTLLFDGPGALSTGGGSVSNVTIASGNRAVSTSTLTGDLSMTGGSLTLGDNQTLAVAGSASLTGGTLVFEDLSAGNELLDVEGALTLTCASSGTTSNTLVRAGGDYASSAAFTWAGGLVELDGGTTATVSGLGTTLPSLNVLSGTKTVTDALALSGDLEVASGATLDTDAALTVGGKVLLGDATASWDLGAATHTVVGNFTSIGADAIGTGTVELSGTGGLSTGSATIANVLISGGARTVSTSAIAGDLTMTGGSLDLQDDRILTVGGNASLTGGTLTFVDTTTGLEILDVDGSLTLTCGSGGTSANTRIRCGTDYTSSAVFTWTDGRVQLDGGLAGTVSGAGTSFHHLDVVSGTKLVAAAITVAGDLDVASGATLDADAAIAVAGDVTLGDGTALWDVGASTHTIAGSLTSAGASATGAGTLALDGSGSHTSGGGSLPNVQLSGGPHTLGALATVGDLGVTTGAVTLSDNVLVAVGGGFTMAPGTTLTFDDLTPGQEILDVDGAVDVSATNGGTTVNTLIRCGGNWTSTADFALVDAQVELDSGTVATLGGSGPIFHHLKVASGTKQALSAVVVNGNLQIGTLATLDADAPFDVAGDVTLQSTSFWDLGVDTHTVAGDLTTNSGSCTGTGTVEFDGTGVLSTGAGSVANVLVSDGFRLCESSSVVGDLSMTGGGLTIGDNQTVTVGGNASLTAGQLSFAIGAAGDEVLDVQGDVTLTATSGNTSAASVLRCAGNWSSSDLWAPNDGVVQLDGGTATTIAGTLPTFADLQVVSGTKTLTVPALVVGTLQVDTGATLDTDAALDVDGSVVLGGASALWDVGTSTHTVSGGWTSSGASATGSGTIRFDGPGTLLPTTGTLPNVEVALGERVCFGTNITGDLTLTGGGITVENDRSVNVAGNASFNAGTVTWLGDGLGVQEGFNVEGNCTVLATVGGETADSVIFCGGNWSSSAAFAPTLGTLILDGGGPATVDGPSLGSVEVASGVKTVVSPALIAGDLTVASGQTLDTDAALDVDGDVVLGDGTALWDMGVDTHTVAGDWSSAGASATGSGVVVFDSGGIVQTNPGAISNVTVAAGFRLWEDSTITGNLSMTGGGITIGDNQTLVVDGNADLLSGQIAFVDTTAGIELIDVAGDMTVTGVAGNTSANSIIRCAGDWTGNSSFSPTAGTVELDGLAASAISGAAPGFDPTFNELVLTNAVRTAGSDITLDAGALHVQGTSGLTVPGGVTVGIPSASVQVSGVLDVEPGGDLRLGAGAAVSVLPSGTLELVGTSGSPASLSGYAGGGYLVNIDGTLDALDFEISDMGAAGILCSSAATIPNLRSGTFSGPSPTVNSVMLDIRRSVPTEFRYVDFVDAGGVGTYNVRVLSGAVITFVNSTGSFSGDAFEQDPFDLVDWTTETVEVAYFTASPGPDQVSLDWESTSEEGTVSFIVKSSTSPGGPFTDIATIPATGPGVYNHVDSSVTPKQKTYYQLHADQGAGGQVLLGSDDANPWSASPPPNFLTVGVGGAHATIQDAINAISGPSPVIRVAPGTYPPFTVTPVVPGTVRILGDGTGPVFIDTTTGPVQILNLGVFNNVELGDMEIGDPLSPNAGLVVQNCLGVVVLDELVVHGGTGLPGVQVTGSIRVAIQRSDMDGTPGLDVNTGSGVIASRGSLDELNVAGSSNVRTCQLTTVPTVAGGSSLTEFTGVMPDVDMPEFVSIGDPFDMVFTGEPGFLFGLFFSFDLFWLDLPATADMVALHNFTPGTLLLSGAFGASPTALGFSMPETGAFFGATLVFQAVSVNPGDLSARWSNVTTLMGSE